MLRQVPTLSTGQAMVSGSDPTSLLVMQIIQSDLASIGFSLTIDQRDPASFNTRLVAGEFALPSPGRRRQMSVPRIVQNSLMRTPATRSGPTERRRRSTARPSPR